MMNSLRGNVHSCNRDIHKGSAVRMYLKNMIRFFLKRNFKKCVQMKQDYPTLE